MGFDWMKDEGPMFGNNSGCVKDYCWSRISCSTALSCFTKRIDIFMAVEPSSYVEKKHIVMIKNGDELTEYLEASGNCYLHTHKCENWISNLLIMQYKIRIKWQFWINFCREIDKIIMTKEWYTFLRDAWILNQYTFSKFLIIHRSWYYLFSFL